MVCRGGRGRGYCAAEEGGGGSGEDEGAGLVCLVTECCWELVGRGLLVTTDWTVGGSRVIQELRSATTETMRFIYGQELTDPADIYRQLALIPFHDPALPTERELQSQAKEPAESRGGLPADQRHPVLRVAFYVWKPRPAFKKSSPGPPDFRIAVLNAREDNFPLPEQLDGLLQSVPYDPPPERMEKQMYQKLKHGWRNVILAAVDQGVVSYVRIADAGFGKEKLYERTGGGRGGKRGGGRGGRAGRGRGRGNGR